LVDWRTVATHHLSAEPPKPASGSRFGWLGRGSRFKPGKWLKLVRRVHLYAGLLFFPWLVFFGLSGVLFNHPNVGEEVVGRRLAPDRVRELTGTTAWEPERLAREVSDALNAKQPERSFTFDATFESRFTGPVVMKAPAPEGLHFVLFDLERGAGVLATRKARPSAEKAPFSGAEVKLDGYSLSELETRFEKVPEALEVTALSKLRIDSKLAPHLEFRVTDRDGVKWNVVYDLETGTVTGRRSDRAPSIGVSQLFGMLHKTHHYTPNLEPRFFWALFEDLLGLSMALFGLTGLVMWWQMKPTRTIGAVGLALTLGVAAIVSYGTARDLLFGDVPQQLGPGE
jgi:hypothetical protein